MKEKKKVYVGLSGGVDSAVSAALLQEKGYEVVGVFIKTWHPDFFPCTESEDRLSAMRVAVRLGIPFTTLDLSDTYRREVAEEMIGEYKKGRTPNPDVLCNKSVKFGGFYDFAVSEGADYIATGHYARTENGLLFTGKDSAKDQSYFLWMVPSSVLSRTLFPLGLLTKGEVRARARALGLPNAARPDSQGICFLGDISMKDFLSHYIELKDGDVLDEKGSVIGRHKGSILYTIGERHGFEISPLSPHEHSRYVVAKDVGRNTLTVSSSPLSDKSGGEIVLSRTQWIGEVTPGTYKARFRYRQPLIDVRLGSSSTVHLGSPATLPVGQSLVFYDKERCLGGGIVDESH